MNRDKPLIFCFKAYNQLSLSDKHRRDAQYCIQANCHFNKNKTMQQNGKGNTEGKFGSYWFWLILGNCVA